MIEERLHTEGMTREELMAAKIACPETGIEIHKSVCAICDPQHCGLKCYVKDGKIIKVEGNENHPNNHGSLCSKGASTRQYVYSEKRIRTPLKRVGARGEGKFEPISWEEAMDTIVERLNGLKKEYGPQSVMFATGFSKFMRPYLKRMALLFGTPNYFTESGVCSEANIMAQELVFGTSAGADQANAQVLLYWSTNPFYTGMDGSKTLQAALKRGAKLIVVDPRLTPTSDRAHIHLRLRPGTDGALALAMANVIIQEDYVDHAFVDNYTYGYEEYRDYVRTFTPEKAEAITGVPADLIREAARMYGKAERAAIIGSASPVVHHTNGVQNYRAVYSLAGLTGNFNRKGGQILALPCFMAPGLFRNQCAQFGQPVSWDSLPPRVGTKRFPIWGTMSGDDAQGMDIPNQIRSGDPYPLKAFMGFGFNYRMYPDPENVISALKELDFLVGVDLFMNDTIKYMDLVLPACSSVERSELHFYGTHIILTQPAIPPLYESRNDVDIIIELAQKLGLKDPVFDAGFDACVNYMLEPSGITAEELRKYPDGFPIPQEIMEFVPDEQYKTQGFHTPTGKLEFKSSRLEPFKDKEGYDPLPVYREPKRSPLSTPELFKEYDLVFNTGSRLPMMVHSRMYHVPWTKVMMPMGTVCEMNPIDGEKRGIQTGDWVRVSTPEGSIEVRANLTERVLPGVAHVFHGNRKADVNKMIPRDYCDPISGFPGFKSSLCKVEKIEGGKRCE